MQRGRKDEFSEIIIIKSTIPFIFGHKEHSHLFKIQIMLLLHQGEYQCKQLYQTSYYKL